MSGFVSLLHLVVECDLYFTFTSHWDCYSGIEMVGGWKMLILFPWPRVKSEWVKKLRR